MRNGGALGVGYVAQQRPAVDVDSPRYTSQVRTKEDVFFEQKQKIEGGVGLRKKSLVQNISSF